MPKMRMFCLECDNVTMHKRRLFQRKWWDCRICKTERPLKDLIDHIIAFKKMKLREARKKK